MGVGFVFVFVERSRLKRVDLVGWLDNIVGGSERARPYVTNKSIEPLETAAIMLLLGKPEGYEFKIQLVRLCFSM